MTLLTKEFMIVNYEWLQYKYGKKKERRKEKGTRSTDQVKLI